MTSTHPPGTDLLEEDGINFGAASDGAGTTAATRRILADAAALVDPQLAQRIRAAGRWRFEYAAALTELTRAESRSHAASLAIARAGLQSTRDTLSYSRQGRACHLHEIRSAVAPRGSFGIEQITGQSAPVTELLVPYRGEVLRGKSLLAQLRQWVETGVVEPSFATAIERVIDNPHWLSMPGRRMVVIGAGSEMGPLAPLTQWGANVIAVDIAAPAMWSRIAETARRGAGTVTLPTRHDGGYGLDINTELPEFLSWNDRFVDEEPLVVGMYAYADRGLHVKLTAAVDTLVADLLTRRPDTAIAYLATPTDVFAVDGAITTFARSAYARRRLARVGRLLTAGRAFAPAYRSRPPEGTASLADSLVIQQGPNYAIAKRMQRWRGYAAASAGHTVSFNVAPPSWTRSVTRNRVLAAAYHGASRFGAEIFPADTARTVMAALLVHDVYTRPQTAAQPERLFMEQAAHGGLWRTGYEPRSVLPIATVVGLPKLLGRGPQT